MAISRKDQQTTDQLPVGLRRLASAEIAERPSRIPEHAQFVVLAEQSEKRLQSSFLQYIVPALRTVACNITKGPNSLFTHIQHRR